jgi:hypothetical protein
MSLEMKILLALAPVGLVAIAYALAHGDLSVAGTLVFIEVLVVVCYRNEKRLQRRP